MKRTILLGMTIMLITTLLSGCFWPRHNGYGGGEERGQEEHREERR